jgi:glutaredoxin
VRRAAVRVRLYERAGCHLCKDAYRALVRLGLGVERVDIERDPALVDRYALRIPVLAVGESELDAAGLDGAAIQRWIEERPPPG